MSSLVRAEPELVGARGAPRSLRYLRQALVATALVSVVPVVVVWGLRNRGVIRSPWIALPLAVGLSLLAAAVGSAWWSRRRRGEELMFSELLLWGWLRRVYVDHQVERAVGLLRLTGPLERAGGGDVTVERRAQLLSVLAGALEAQDPYLEGHSQRVARHATMIARKIGLSGDQVARIRRGAVLHDVGKLRVPQGILNKPGRLSAAEFDQVKRHAEEGAKLVADLGDDELTSIVRHHHEWVDGTGYPDGLRGADIPLGARVIAVADIYDALTAARSYRAATPHKQAFDTLREESLTHLDPELVRAFRGCYSGRGPLVFWESLAGWMQALHFFPHAKPAIAKRVSLRDLTATTLATTAIAVAAIAAPIGARSRATHPAAPSLTPTVAFRPTHASPPGSARGRTRPEAAHAPRVTRIVVPQPTRSTGVPLAPHLTQTAGARRSTRRSIGQTPSLSTGRPLPSAHPPTTTVHQPPPRPRPRPKPRPPITAPVNPPRAPPTTPTSVAPTTTTVQASTPTSTPAPPPTTTATANPVSKDACKNGGFVQYGFSNQGQCVAAAERGP